MVLWPSPDNNEKTDNEVLNCPETEPRLSVMGQWKDQMEAVGLVDDYDYEKHMKPITGSGDYSKLQKEW